ncbi:MAG: hypothetical protein ACHQC8_02440 [Solirubrobacterales bacterium]
MYTPKPPVKPKPPPPIQFPSRASRDETGPFAVTPGALTPPGGGGGAPPGGGGGGAPPPGGGGGGAAPAAAPAGAATSANGKDPLVAAGFSQAYANQLYDLQNQWELLSGYAQPITTDQLIAMATEHVAGMTEFSRYVWNNVLPSSTPGSKAWNAKDAMPWLQFGMDPDTYHSRLSQIATDWQRYTGQVLNANDGGLGQDWVNKQLGGVTPGLAAPSIVDDPALQKAFGWVKYGLTFRDYQLKKDQMDQAFGSTLTDAEAVTQLHYFQAAQGSAQTARAVQKQPGQQAPTGEVASATVR